ncbi:unnamed protein product [marine sediment metagenome]|uniref:TM2 domain-containing protein n=1 Tax=marine sediment metagenome TaxID=412755 RepID=X1SBJ8_9ZZZZ
MSKKENNTDMLLAKSEFKNSTTIWLLFLFLGWSYGNLGKIGLQILYYITFGCLGLWTIIRLFTLNQSIRNYNQNICVRFNLTTDQMKKLGVLK